MNDQGNKNEDTWSKTRRFYALLAVLGVLVAQIFLYLFPEQEQVVFPTPFWFALGAAVVFVILSFLRLPKFLKFPIPAFLLSNNTLFITAAIGFAIFATIGCIDFGKSSRTAYIPINLIWLASALCYVAAYFPFTDLVHRVRAVFREHRWEIVAVGLVTLMGAIFRFFELGHIPYVINGDEGLIGMVAQSTNKGAYANPFALWENFGAFYLQAIATSMRIFGVNSFGLRLLPALGGTIAIPAVYLLARELTEKKKIALIAAFFVATAHSNISFSRTVAAAYIHGTWLVPFEFFFLYRGLKHRSSWSAALGGGLLAIHYCVYISSQVATALILVYMLILLIFYHAWFKTVYRQFLVFWAGFIIVFLPELAYILQYPNEFFSRMNAAGTFSSGSGWLAQTALSSGKSVVQVLGERVLHAFLTLIYYPSFDFYGTPVPVLTFITAGFFIIGLVIVLLRTRQRGYLLINGYFWAFTLAVGIFALPPSADSYRMLSALPAALIIAAVGFDQILEIFGFQWQKSRVPYALAVGGTLVAILFTNIWIYFFDFANACKYGGEDTQTRFSTHLGYYLSSVQPGSTVYLLNDEIIFYGQNAAVDFLSNKMKVTNFPGPVDQIEPIPGTVIIAIPKRIEELRKWSQAHAGGQFTYQNDCQTTILSAYTIP